MKHALELLDPAGEESPSCASLLRLLADETRLAVVEQLFEEPRSVAEINKSVGVEQSLLSYHLRVLREAGLVKAERNGKQMLYSLAKEVRGKRRAQAIDLGCCLISFD